MPDREKVIKGLNDIGGFIAGRVGFEQARNFLQTINDALALLKEQDDLGTELTNAVELIRKKNEQIEKLLKEQEAKQGKWERHYSRPGVYADLFWWCSVCGEPTRYNDAGIFYQYCPHCGAKLEPCEET